MWGPNEEKTAPTWSTYFAMVSAWTAFLPAAVANLWEALIWSNSSLVPWLAWCRSMCSILWKCQSRLPFRLLKIRSWWEYAAAWWKKARLEVVWSHALLKWKFLEASCISAAALPTSTACLWCFRSSVRDGTWPCVRLAVFLKETENLPCGAARTSLERNKRMVEQRK